MSHKPKNDRSFAATASKALDRAEVATQAVSEQVAKKTQVMLPAYREETARIQAPPATVATQVMRAGESASDAAKRILAHASDKLARATSALPTVRASFTLTVTAR